MDFPSPSRRSYGIPKPEAGLAEWTSKIKELQRQVDADEEDEQKRLEEEIAAARKARIRRSRGMGGRTDSLDFSSSTEKLSIPASPAEPAFDSAPKSSYERGLAQNSALQKLMGRNEVHNPDTVGLPDTGKDPLSLATFMGGRATGPRLNKHAPQQDVHDPTQFIQPDLKKPHPVFGNGGIAMPGMAKTGSSTVAGSEMSERYRPSSSTTPKSPSLHSGPSHKSENTEIRLAANTNYTPPSQGRNHNDDLSSTKSPAFNSMGSTDKPRHTEEKADDISVKGPGGNTYSAPSVSLSRSFTDKNDTKRDLLTSPSTTSVAVVNTVSDNFKPLRKSTSPLPSYLKPNDVATSESTPLTAPKDTFRSYSSPSFKSTSTATPLASSDAQRTKTLPQASDTPLRRLMERNNVYNPDKDSSTSRKTVAERVQTTSLAAFMGAPGKGIRLNKHAPQPDAHDPTQFIQPDLSAPHPIFGKGGIAMPGMIPSGGSSPNAAVDISSGVKPSQMKKPSWPPVSTSSSQERFVSTRKEERERTVSAPRPASSGGESGAQVSGGWTSSHRTTRAQSPTKEVSNISTPARDRTVSTPSFPYSKTTANSSPSLISPPPRPSVVSLVRSIQPTSKSVSSSSLPASGYQKPPQPKDLTPSLSRLQGRGFVQNAIKASSQLETTPPSPTLDKSRPSSSSGKKGSVLDRWQPNTSNPIAHPTSKPLTTNPTSPHKFESPPLDQSPSSPVAAPTATEAPYLRSRTPGLGSATTMVVIQPSVSSTNFSEPSSVDELGLKVRASNYPTNGSIGAREPEIQDSTDNVQPHSLESSISSDVSLQHITSRSTPADTPVLPTAPPNAAVSHRPYLLQDVQSTPTHTMDATDGLVHSIATDAPLSPTNFKPTVASSKDRNAAQPPQKHARIPSTGKRPTVMEVAQALIDHPPPDKTGAPPLSPIVDATKLSDERVPAARSRAPLAQIQAEKRKSNYERYSAIILPSLKEEATPTPSPAGSLKNMPVQHVQSLLKQSSEVEQEPGPYPVIPDSPHVDASTKGIDVVPVSPQDSLPIDLESINVDRILSTGPPADQQLTDSKTISVEVLSVVGTAATAVQGHSDVFYDTEILAIVHRVKSQSTGLATTSVWCWLGRQTRLGDREEKKLHDLAKRYGTSIKLVHQSSEPRELVQLLGGRLAIRQGTRLHWTSENTTMHLVRSFNGVVYVDERDFSIHNLCSGFSYCLTILGSIYVWHGCGSTHSERSSAMEYCQTLSLGPVAPIELIEGETDEDEMFWMMLGDDDFANADHWKWRHGSSSIDPSVFRVDLGGPSEMPVVFVPSIAMDPPLHSSVYVVNCVWELFVVVGKNARGQRRVIRAALDLAKKISNAVAPLRPFKPVVHVVVLPSRLPRDLQLAIRDFDEVWLNDGDIPDHMNLLSVAEAEAHLNTNAWPRSLLNDLTMLPVGIDPSILS